MASNHLDESLIEGIEPFNTMDIPAYSPDYLSGYSSEIYTVDLKDAAPRGKNKNECGPLQYG